MKKLLLISGPTATGKTTLAVNLAKKFNGELISADSRQIYQGMDIGTGKDHPKDTVIHLIDIITPDQPFSVAQYCRLSTKKISEIQSRGKLPIIVGGTGQYIDSTINPKPTFSIKPNKFLRFFLNKFPTKLLQLILRLIKPSTFRLLNNSDRNNPHRLIRKIEIEISSLPKNLETESYNVKGYLHISLTAPNSYIFSKINQRVQERLKEGLLSEIEILLKKYKWTDPGLNTLAYKEFIMLGRGQSLSECVSKWQSNEHNYVRRQKTWFKKQPNLHIIDISKIHQRQIISIVSRWYNKI